MKLRVQLNPEEDFFLTNERPSSNGWYEDAGYDYDDIDIQISLKSFCEMEGNYLQWFQKWLQENAEMKMRATAHKVAERQREEEEEKEREQMEYRAAQRNQKKQKTNPGYVYLVGAENGNYKIGKAKNVDERVNTFGVKLPIKTWLVHSFSSNDYSKAEAVLHEQFSEKRTHGEWFLLADEDVEYIKALQDGAL
jgi:hypothetical protein